MDRRQFFHQFSISLASLVAVTSIGCKGTQYAHVLSPTDTNMVGSHTAGAETWEPLIQQSVGQLLAREQSSVTLTSHTGEPCKKRICFMHVDNRSSEEIGDFGDQIYQKIDTIINGSETFELVNIRAVKAALQQANLRPDDLYTPSARRKLAGVMEQEREPIDYFLYATITSGTTRSNGKDYQRDYLLTLELVNFETGHTEKESAELRKGYHKSKLGKLRNYGQG
ncbi:MULTISPECIES: penicillin-binding protein activator LpoB [unclassified Schlesneria]|uniref:penicillin-binding protein activator LpoB n=1 Tax=unclassified Schlesneria TaxID=2762017 RepID=UPI002EFC436B